MHYSKLIIMLLAIIAMGACSNKAEKAQMLYQQGEQLIKKDHKWTEAGEMLLGSLQLQDENEPTPLLARTYALLSKVYWEEDRVKKAIEYAHRGLNTALAMRNDTLHLQLYTRVGSSYYLIHKNDSATYYFNKALDKATAMNDSNGIYNAYNNLGALKLSMEKFDEALAYFDKSYSYARNIDAHEFHYYYNKSRCYQYLKQWTLCIDATRKAIANIPKEDLEGRSKLYQRLFLAERSIGNYEAACVAADTSYNYLDKYWNQRRDEDMRDLTEQYQQERYNAQLKLQRTQWMVMVVVVLMIMGAAIMFVSHRNKKRIMRLQKRLENLKLQIYRERNTIQQTAEESQNKVGQTMPNNEKLYTLCLQQLAVARDLFKMRPEYMRLYQLKYRTDHQYLSDPERMPLLDSVVEVFIEPLQNLRRLFTELTEDECIYAILTFLGCNNATISMMTKTSEPTLRKRRSRFKQKSHDMVFRFLMQNEEA